LALVFWIGYSGGRNNMGLLLVCMGILVIVCFALAIFVDVSWIIGVFALLAIIIFTPTVAGNTYPLNYHYKATVDGVIDQGTSTEIYFEGYVQDGQTVTIDGYSYRMLHWLNFKNYDEFNKILKIQIPDGAKFQYKIINPLIQKVIN
jgi:hypothetical protein